MSKKDSLTPQGKKENGGLKLHISLMVILILFIAEVYIIVNRPQNFVALAGITLLLLVWVYLFINAVLQETIRHRDNTIEQYQNILKSEKASYLLLKKAFEQMQSGNQSVTLPTEEIISAQKALAKVTIGRSRENTEALLNSHDKVMEMLYGFEEKLLQNNNELISSQKMIADSSAQEQLLKQQEIIAGIRETELSLKNEIQQLAETVADLQAAQSMQPVYIQEPVQQDKPISLDEPLSGDITGAAYEPGLGDFVSGEAPVMAEEQFPAASSAPDDFVDLSDAAFPEDLGDLDDTAFLDEAEDLDGLADTVFSEDLGLMDDTTAIGEFAFMDEAAEANESSEGGELYQEDIVLPDEQLFPEDIPAMEDLAAADNGNEVPETSLVEEFLSGQAQTAELEAEKLPEGIPELEAEKTPAEKPAAPDLSNPNKMLTPEEIAALIASM